MPSDLCATGAAKRSTGEPLIVIAIEVWHAFKYSAQASRCAAASVNTVTPRVKTHSRKQR